MKQTLTLRDGAIGYAAGLGAAMACIAVATGGPVNTPQLCATPSAVQDAFTSGRLVDRSGFYFEQEAPGPLLLIRCAASTAGSLPAYAKAASDALAGNAAGNGFQNLVFTGPANIEVVFAAQWDGGNVTLTGTAVGGGSQTEVITAAAGSTVKGNKVFATLASAVKGAVGAQAATATLQSGNKTAAGDSSDAQMVLSGSPLEDLDLVVQITRNGSTAAAPLAACKISYDGGDTYGAETLIPVGGAVTGQYGLTVTFSGSALKSGDVFRQLTVGPSPTTQDLTTALAALATTTYEFRFLHIAHPLTGSQAATVNSWVNLQRAAGRWFQVLLEVRDYNAGESDAAWQASLQADFASVVAPFGQLGAVPGHWEHVMPAGRGIQRRSWSWSVGAQLALTSPGAHPGAPGEAGPLRGVYTPITGQQPYTHDERLQPGLGGSGGRFLTVQTHLGREFQGQWFIGDGDGLRSPGTLAAGASDYSLWMNVELMMILARALQTKNTLLLGKRLATKKDGSLFEWQAKKLDKELTAWVRRRLVDTGYAQEVSVAVSRTEAIYTTKKLPYTARLKPFSVVEWVAAELSFAAAIVV